MEIGTDILSEERQQVEHLLGNYAYLFSHTESTMGRTRLVEHEIDTEASRPVRQNPYRSSTFEHNTISEQVARMLQEGVIRESSRFRSSPVILVRKRDGSWRFCIDFRRINAMTRKDVHPLPRIDDTIDRVQES